MTISVIAEADSITLEWTTLEVHSRTLTASDVANYTDDNGVLDPSMLYQLAADLESRSTYVKTVEREITDVDAEDLELRSG